MDSLNVNEIFYSIQGEGSRSGLPCVFVRLHGCGLRCGWCDTTYALDHRTGGTIRTFDDMLAEIATYHCRFIELTGGEPLEQDASYTFLRLLCDEGYTVALETGGHVDISRVDPRVTVIMDLKCPGSGMLKRNLFDNIEYLKPGDEIKFVIRDRTDYEWARSVTRERELTTACSSVLFSPVFGEMHPRLLANWILEDHLPVRLQLQMHKHIWPPDMRGV